MTKTVFALVAATLSAAAVEAAFIRTEERAVMPGDRPRRVKKTLIIPEWEPYYPSKNMMHVWHDRSLFSDPALREGKEGHAAWLRDVEIVRECGFDGLASLCYEATHLTQLKLLGRYPPPEGYSQMIVLGGGGESAYPRFKNLIVQASKSPYTTRIDGKVLIWTYHGSAKDRMALARRLKADKDIPPHIFVAGMPMFEIYKAFSEYDGAGKGPIPAGIVDRERANIAAAAKAYGGFQHWCTEFEYDHLGSYAHRYCPTDIWRRYLLPLALEELKKPENRDKIVGRYVNAGYVNRFVGWVHGQWGTRSLRTGLDEIMPLNPDVLVPFEWNEQNENTHFQPTVANGKTFARVLNYYRALLDRETPKPMKGDDPTVPNIVVSLRQAIQLGEEWHVELLYLPDGAAVREFSAQLALKSSDGRTLQTFPVEKFRTDELLAVNYRVPGERFPREESLSVELVTEYGGARKTWKGFDSTRVRTTTCRDYLYSHMPLREMLDPVGVAFTATPAGDGAYDLAARFEAGEDLASVELLDDLEEVAADDPDRVYDRSKRAVFRCSFDILKARALGGGRKDYRAGTIMFPGAPNAVVKEANMNWGGFSLRGCTNGMWHATVNCTSVASLFDVLVPLDELAGSRMVMDFPILGRVEFPLDECRRLGRIDRQTAGTVHVDLRRMELLEDMPRHLNARKSSFRAKRVSGNRFPAYQLRAISKSGKIWRSRIIHPKVHAPVMRRLTVHSDRMRKGVEVDVPADSVPVLDYRFDPEAGALLRCGWEPAYDATLGGGGNYSGPMQHAGNRLPADFLRADPVWVTEDGSWTLRFDNGSYMILPREAIPHGSEFTMEFEIKPDDADNYVLLRTRDCTSKECGLELFVKGGTLHASYRGVKLYKMPDFDTGRNLPVGKWNSVKVEKTFSAISVTVNGATKSFAYDRRARLFSASVFGGNVAPGELIPEGVKPFNGYLRGLRITHSVGR